MFYNAEIYEGKTFLKTYLEHKTEESFDETINIILSSEKIENLKKIKSISLADYTAECFFDKMIIHHKNRHSDPLFFIQDKNNQPAIEINIYDLDAFKKAKNKLILHTDQEDIEIEPQTIEQTYKTNFKSEIIKEKSDFILKIKTPYQIELIEQRLQWGVFNEKRNILKPGNHSIKLPNAFADWYGIALSPTSIYDKIEHKHMVMGHLGKPSSRWVIDPILNKTFSPEKPFFFHKTAIINALEIDYNKPLDVKEDIFDEYEIVVYDTIDQKQEKIITSKLTKPYIITYFNKDSQTIKNKFVQSKSQNLFMNSNENILFDKKEEYFSKQLEQSWITSYFPTDNNAQYGISFSYPRENLSDPKLNIRRFFDPNSACSTCSKNIIEKCKRLHPNGFVNIKPKEKCSLKIELLK